MRPVLTRLAMLAVLAMAQSFGTAFAQAPAASAAYAPTCSGRDLVAELADKDPTAWADVKEKARTTLNGDGLFWRVEGKGATAIYIFVTIHLSDDRVTKLSPAVSAGR